MNVPQRIASLLSSATEMLYLLGLGDRVVGVSHECDFPADATAKPRLTRSNIDGNAGSLAIDRQVKLLLESGQPLYEIDVPWLLALRPDLIVTQAQCDVCAVRYADVLDLVHREPELRGIPVVDLNPCSLSDVLADIVRVADAAGVSETGRHVSAELQKRIDAIRFTTAALSPAERPRVACIEWTDPLMLAANWMPELVQFAGGRHDLTTAGVHSGYAVWEQLIHYDPQVVLVMPCGFDLQRSFIEGLALADRPGWLDLDAVRSGRVYAVDANAHFNRPGPRLVESLELLAHLLHPQRCLPPKAGKQKELYRVVPDSQTCDVDSAATS